MEVFDTHGCVELDDDHVATRVDLDGLSLVDACNEVLLQTGIAWMQLDRCVEPDLVDHVHLVRVDVSHNRHTREAEPDFEVVIRSDRVVTPPLLVVNTRRVSD